MRQGVWLRPLVYRAHLIQHFVPGHLLNALFYGQELLGCGQDVMTLRPGAVLQAFAPDHNKPMCDDCLNCYLEQPPNPATV